MKSKYSDWRQELTEKGPELPPVPPKKNQQPVPPPAPVTRQNTLNPPVQQPTTFTRRAEQAKQRLQSTSTPTPAVTPAPAPVAKKPSWLDKTLKGVQSIFTRNPNPSSGPTGPTPPPTPPVTPKKNIVRRTASTTGGTPLAAAITDVTTQGPSAIVPAAGGLTAAAAQTAISNRITKKLGIAKRAPWLNRLTGVGRETTALGAYNVGKTLTKDVLRGVGFNYEQKSFNQFMTSCLQEQTEEQCVMIVAEAMLSSGYDVDTFEDVAQVLESMSDEELNQLMELQLPSGAQVKQALNPKNLMKRARNFFGPPVVAGLALPDKLNPYVRVGKETSRLPQPLKTAADFASISPAGAAVGTGMIAHDVYSKAVKAEREKKLKDPKNPESYLSGYQQ